MPFNVDKCKAMHTDPGNCNHSYQIQGKPLRTVFLEYPEEEKWDKITTNQEMFLSEKVKFYWTTSCGQK